jgi:hypothetical protein
VRCFKCGGKGHFARDCSAEAKERSCFLCAQVRCDGWKRGKGTRQMGAGPMRASAALHWPATTRLPTRAANNPASACLPHHPLGCSMGTTAATAPTACAGAASGRATWRGTAPMATASRPAGMRPPQRCACAAAARPAPAQARRTLSGEAALDGGTDMLGRRRHLSGSRIAG